MDPLIEWLVLGHRTLGYATAFLIGPAALLASGSVRAPAHRRWGWAYLTAMCVLYVSGTGFGFRRHPLDSYELWRNLAFNFFGFYFVLYGVRAMVRMNRRRHAAAALDRAMWTLLAVVSAALFGLGLRGHFPSTIFGALGLWLAWHEWPELRGGSSARRLYARHLRCMYASYLYVLTVLTLVDLRALPGDLRWLWPTLLGVPLMVYATRAGPDKRRLRHAILGALAAGLVLGAGVAALPGQR